MRRYSQYLSEELRSFASLQNYASGVHTFCIFTKHSFPDPSEYFTVLTNNGLKDILSLAVKQAKPVTSQLFRAMFEFVDFNDMKQLVT